MISIVDVGYDCLLYSSDSLDPNSSLFCPRCVQYIGGASTAVNQSKKGMGDLLDEQFYAIRMSYEIYHC